MIFTCSEVSIAQYTDASKIHDVVRRQGHEAWLVAYSPVYPGAAVEWTRCEKDEVVIIPVVPYRMAADISRAAGFMFQIGFYAATTVGYPVARVHISLGYPFESLRENGSAAIWRGYIGVSVLLRDNLGSR